MWRMVGITCVLAVCVQGCLGRQSSLPTKQARAMKGDAVVAPTQGLSEHNLKLYNARTAELKKAYDELPEVIEQATSQERQRRLKAE